MYGMVNQGIQTFVCENHGEETWRKIIAKAGLEDQTFETMLAYDDAITYQLVGAASEVLDLPTDQILELFGDYWVDFASQTAIGRLLSFGGDSLFEIIYNLNDMHERIQMTLPHLRPPRFEFFETETEWYELHYISPREGLQPMVFGLIKGLARMCGEDVEIKLRDSRMDGADHDIFEMRIVTAEKSAPQVA